jgi:hypothetical protein
MVMWMRRYELVAGMSASDAGLLGVVNRIDHGLKCAINRSMDGQRLVREYLGLICDLSQ